MLRPIGVAGPNGSGKSSLAREMARMLGSHAVVVSTSAILKERLGPRETVPTRDELFALGERLDAVDPAWVWGAHLLTVGDAHDKCVIVDAVRSKRQADAIRAMGGVIVHALDDSSVVDKSLGTYAFGDPTAWRGDPVTGPRTRALGVLERLHFGHGADAVIGAQWGSEGKGKIAAWLASQRGIHYSAMARAGGPNAGHRVELPSGGYKVFRHLPSATPYAKPGTILCIGPGAVVDLAVLAGEVDQVPDGVEVRIDPRVAVVTDLDLYLEKEANLTEVGSTMTGTGGAMANRVLRRGTTMADVLAGRRTVVGSFPGGPPWMCEWLQGKVEPVGPVLREAAMRGRLLLESTQGMQLSLFHGAYPKVTSRDVSPVALLSELGLPADLFVEWWVVARTFPIRVSGPSGDLPNEVTWAEVSKTSGRAQEDLEKAERTSVTNRLRRVATWKRGMLLEAVRQGFYNTSVVHVAVTFADYLDHDKPALETILQEARACTRQPIAVGFGPKTADVYLSH